MASYVCCFSERWLSLSGAGPEGGARLPVFATNSLKSPLNWPEYAQKLAPEPPAPPPFSNPGSAPVCLNNILKCTECDTNSSLT